MTTAPAIRVGLADDQPLFTAGVALVLGSQPDLEVAWQAVNGADALERNAADPVDVLLMDVQMPVLDGIAATAALTGGRATGGGVCATGGVATGVGATGVAGAAGDGGATASHGGVTTRVVVLTTFDTQEYVVDALGAGASGFLLKDSPPEELLAAVRTVHSGEAVISPRATKRLIDHLRPMFTPEAPDSGPAPGRTRRILADLTPRETEILIAVAKGWSNTEICERLVVSMPTVKTHVSRVLAKTGSRDRVQAVLFAFRAGLVGRDDLLAP